MKKGKAASRTWYEKVYIALLLVIFGGIILHAPLSVGFSVLFPHFALVIKSWKEILMGVAGILLLVILHRQKKWRLLREPLVLLIAAFAIVTLLVLPFLWQGTKETLAGILIDLRYPLYFVFVYVALKLYTSLRRPFLLIGLIGALVATLFAVLQVTVLPYDILKYIGYSKSTIVPYLTVDLNQALIRVNSTFRGPNPLGAYAGMVVTLLAAYLVRGQLKKTKRPQIIAAVLAAASLVSVWVSYSRSALLGVVIGVLAVLVVAYGRKVSRKVWLGVAIGIIVVAGLLVAFRNVNIISSVVFHQNLDGGSSTNSDEGHVSSLKQSFLADITHPFGLGVGSTGSASLLGAKPDVIENQYLFDAHEAGYMALILFVIIYVVLLRGLWRKRSDWLALGMFASGLGLAAIGLLLPVWADDTVSIVWWGLAAVAYASNGGVLQSGHHGKSTSKHTTSATGSRGKRARTSR